MDRGPLVGLALATLLLPAGCTPPLDPSWLVTGPRELALEVEVVEQGPYGDRITPSPRTPRDALPLDTLALRPVVVDPDGVLDPDGLEGAWMLCAGIGNCLLRGPVLDRPACPDDRIQPLDPCEFDRGGEGSLTIPDLPGPALAEVDTIFSLINGPTVAYVASPPEGPGLDACLARLDAREPLAGCLMMERVLGLGPLGDLVDTLEALGVDSGLDPGAESLLARPRNRNPAVQTIRIDHGETLEVSAGERVAVPRDQAVRLTVLTTEDDLDAYEALVGEQTVLFTDDLSAQWWFDQEVERDDLPPGPLTTRFTAGTATGTVRVYVVLRDTLGGEGWGWLDLELSG